MISIIILCASAIVFSDTQSSVARLNEKIGIYAGQGYYPSGSVQIISATNTACQTLYKDNEK